MQHIYIPTQNYKVLVHTITYNQAKYITDTLDGVAMQQTNFPFVHCVIDDCSTDDEQEVIKAWLSEHCNTDKAEYIDIELSHIILVPHKKNKNCTFAIYFLKQNLYGTEMKKTMIAPWNEHCEYKALCEGDDYWTCPQKLQIQVDFLDSHPDYTMCFHDTDIVAEKGRDWYDVFGKLETRDYTVEDVLDAWKTPTASLLYRSYIPSKVPKNDKFKMGDNILVLTCLQYGKIRCIAEKMSAYRLTPTSWIGGQSDKKQRYLYISHYKGMIEEFECCRCDIMYNNMESQYFQLMAILKREGDKEEFERIKTEYLNYPGENHIDSFSVYYRNDTFRYYAKKILYILPLKMRNILYSIIKTILLKR